MIYTSEKIITKTSEVQCSGGEEGSGHPRIFLNIKQEIGYVSCPYCGKHFELEESPKPRNDH